MAPKKLVSVVVPVYNEQDNLPVLHEVATNEFKAISRSYDWEFIFVDDGSTDRSWKVIEKLAAQDPCIKAISFSRNFGHQSALMAGYDVAQGDAIVSIDADMQHPPELIVDMLKEWRKGADVVYARKVNRKDNIVKRFCAFFFYKFLDFISDVTIPRNVSDFRLIDKKVLAVVRACQDGTPYLRGLVAWTGFKQSFVDCQYFKRFSGSTGYTWKKMFQLARDGITGFSLFPLRLSAWAGLLSMFGAFGTATYALASGAGLVVWLFVVVLFLMSGQLFIMWLLGEYVGRVHQQAQRRPLYVIAKKLETKNAIVTAEVVRTKGEHKKERAAP